MESFFNISVSYREDANVKNPYGLVERLKTVGKNLTDIIDKFGDYSWKEFRKIWKQLHPDIKSELEEKFRELKRECFLREVF